MQPKAKLHQMRWCQTEEKSATLKPKRSTIPNPFFCHLTTAGYYTSWICICLHSLYLMIQKVQKKSVACNFKLHNLFHFVNLQEKQHAQIKRQQLPRFSKKIIKLNMKPKSRQLASGDFILWPGEGTWKLAKDTGFPPHTHLFLECFILTVC